MKAVWSAPQGADGPFLGAMPLAAPTALKQPRPLVLGKHSLQLQKQGVLGRVTDRPIMKDHLHPSLGEFPDQNHLVSVAAGEAVGGMNIDNVDRRQGDQIAQALQGGTNQAGPTDAIVDEQVLVRNGMAVLCGMRLQVTDLAVDGVPFSLLIGRDPGVNGGLHWGRGKGL